MQHEILRCPVTALAFFSPDVVLSGEGGHLVAYHVGRKRLASTMVLESQPIHGILTSGEGGNIVIVWGGALVRVLTIEVSNDGLTLQFRPGTLLNLKDWLLDAAISPSSTDGVLTVAFVTAHNSLLTLRVADSLDGSEAIDCLTSSSNCILYSAHVTWLSVSQCLIASGTAFGDIIVWSSTFSSENGKTSAHSEVHLNFAAHEGSVFGVQLSPLVCIPGCEGSRRVLASCSDDRTIRLWDVSDLKAQQELSFAQLDRNTGFPSEPAVGREGPSLLASVMGHVSRIWHVRLTLTNEDLLQRNLVSIISFGEDATVITWKLRNGQSTGKALEFEKVRTQRSHSGKNIWSVATDPLRGSATGGADGAIVLSFLSTASEEVIEVPASILGEPCASDSIRTYALLSSRLLIATTTHGRRMVLDLSRETTTVAEIAGPFDTLESHSIVASVSDAVFVSGKGRIIRGAFSDLGWFEVTGMGAGNKAASLFPCQITQHEIVLVATSVASSTARSFCISRTNGVPKSCELPALNLPQSFVATSFVSFTTDQHNYYFLLGSRQGSVAWFHYDRGAASTHRLQVSQVYHDVHGKEAVTAMRVERTLQNHHLLLSVGRDGTLAVHLLELSSSGGSWELYHKLSLPFGPNIEGLHLTAEAVLLVWGFKSKDFVVFDVTNQTDAMTVACGGARRNWAFRPGEDSYSGTFVWTQGATTYRASALHAHRTLFNSGGHGREIKCVAISETLRHGRQVVATGAEDTNIKLFELDEQGLTCRQTLRRHNTGIQHLQWDENHLFSSGGFEEFFIWKVRPGVPYIGIGVCCESTHPRSGASDLRIMGFDVARRDETAFVITMAYSDSTIKVWGYSKGAWELQMSGDYLTACLTSVARLPGGPDTTTATDGHIAFWQRDSLSDGPGVLTWHSRHKAHQSAIHVSVALQLHDSTLIFTGGDDNALSITRVAGPAAARAIYTLRIPHAHAAAITGLAVVPGANAGIHLISAGLDQRLQRWHVTLDGARPGVAGLAVRRVDGVATCVADVQCVAALALPSGGRGVLVCGAGMHVWHLPAASTDDDDTTPGAVCTRSSADAQAQ